MAGESQAGVVWIQHVHTAHLCTRFHAEEKWNDGLIIPTNAVKRSKGYVREKQSISVEGVFLNNKSFLRHLWLPVALDTSPRSTHSACTPTATLVARTLTDERGTIF